MSSIGGGTVHGVLRSLIADGVRLPVRLCSWSRARPRPAGLADPLLPPRERSATFSVIRCMRAPTATGSGRRRRVGRSPGRRGAARALGLAPREGCLVFIKDRFPAYITYERFEANQARLRGGQSLPGRVARRRPRRRRPAGRASPVRSVREADVRAVRAGRSAAVLHLQYPAIRLRVAAVSRRSRRPGRRPGWPSRSWRCSSRRPWRRASAAAEVEQRRRDGLRHWEQRLERARRYEADRAARQYQACESRRQPAGGPGPWSGGRRRRARAVQRLEADFDRFVRSQPRLVGAATGRERIRRLAGKCRRLHGRSPDDGSGWTGGRSSGCWWTVWC